MAEELVCQGNNIVFKPFSEGFLAIQRLEAPVLSARASGTYTPIQDLESKQLLKNLLTSNDFRNLFERYTASVVYTTTFGMRIVTGEEWQLKVSHECLENIIIAGQFGSWIVNSIPVLNYLPKALAPWKTIAEGYNQKWANLHMTNYTDALDRSGWNWAKDFKSSKEAQNMTDLQVAWALGILCDAGVETTNTQLQILVLACVSFPEAAAKAQEELDRVVGNDRLPEFQDLENLPYIHAVVEESFRWRHIVPTCIPHATTQEDEYKGYRIPKGSIIFPLMKAMREDPTLYDRPEEFRPERWIGKTHQNTFGYGRRVCPGQYLARNSLVIGMARMLWAFNIRSATGKKPNLDESAWTTGLVSAPKPFGASFEVRSEMHKQIIEKSWDQADKDTASLLDSIRQRQIAVGLTPRA